MAKRVVVYISENYRDKWRLERLARTIRREISLTQFDILDPWILADEVPAHVFYVDDLGDPEVAVRSYGANWDGLAFQYPNDPTLMVILNSARPLTRQNATLMEELSHGLLRHEPSQLWKDPTTGLVRRDYNKAQEREAYELGAIILLPKELIQREVKRGMSIQEIASERQCSVDLVAYRIKRCRLWKRCIK